MGEEVLVSLKFLAENYFRFDMYYRINFSNMLDDAQYKNEKWAIDNRDKIKAYINKYDYTERPIVMSFGSFAEAEYLAEKAQEEAKMNKKKNIEKDNEVNEDKPK